MGEKSNCVNLVGIESRVQCMGEIVQVRSVLVVQFRMDGGKFLLSDNRKWLVTLGRKGYDNERGDENIR